MARVHPREGNEATTETKRNTIFEELNIRYRVCYKFQPKSPGEEKICKCNREKNQHTEIMESKTTDQDKPLVTFEKVDPVHGSFPNGSLYARLDLDTPKEKVERILLEAWKIPKPRLIMSIIGGAKYFKLSDRLETNFLNGIINVARKSDAWLFTSGYNIGIVELVGQAINKLKLTDPKQKIIAIGICKWGSVKNVEILTRSKQEEIEQEIVNTPNTSKDNKKHKQRVHGERDLELNHSHYLMLDDGTIRYYNTKDYRTGLAAHMGKLQDEHGFPIPVVTVVVEGGKDTIKNIYYDLKANIPVIIIGDSGRVADFFKRWLLYTKEFDNIAKYPLGEITHDIDELADRSTHESPKSSNQNEHSNLPPLTTASHTEIYLDNSIKKLREMFSKYRSQIKEDICDIISHDDDILSKTKANNQSSKESNEQTDKIISQVMYCLQPTVRSNITIFNLNSDSDLSETIFRSICQSSQRLLNIKAIQRKDKSEIIQQRRKPQYTPIMEQLQLHSEIDIHRHDENAQRSRLLNLAMDWDCIDVANELILKNSIDFLSDPKDPFMRALTNNLPTFIYAFIKLGINPSEIFFPGNQFLQGEFRYKEFFENLYTPKAVNSDTTHLKYFLKIDRTGTKGKIDSIQTLNHILTTLIGDYMHKLYFNKQQDEIEHRVKHGLMKKTTQNNQNTHENGTGRKKKQKEANPSDYIMRDLFLWAILMNYTDMAIVFLSHMKHRICPALIAIKIFNQYHEKATPSELKDGYKKSAKYFEQYAINCLDKCDDHDMDQACEIILQQNELYGYVSCLQVAADAKAKLFIATPCCVQAMNNIWYDKICPGKSLIDMAVLVGLLTFGLLAPVVNFRKGKEQFKNGHREPTLEPYGINYSDPYAFEYPHDDKIGVINRYQRRFINFHQALCVKFYYHSISYIFFLLLFSYVLLFKFQPRAHEIPSIHWTEILTIIFVLCMLIEEIRYFFNLDSVTYSGKLHSYTHDFFKLMTVISIVLFFVGLVLRFVYDDTEDQFSVARIVMAIDIEIWWLRSLSFIIVIPFLGPHLVAIQKMLRDLGFFMCIIAIVTLGYGVSSRSMVYYPNADKFNITTTFDGRSIFRQIVYPVYYFLYGNIDTELSNLDEYPNAGWSISTQVLLAIHMLFVNILLTNLLIAIFSKRFDEVYDDMKNIWYSQQYVFTHEYYTRSPVFPPISLLYDIYCLCRMIFFFISWKCFNKTKDRKAKVFKIIPTEEITIRKWYEFEGASTYEYAHDEVKALAKSTTALDLYNVVKKDEMNDKYDKKYNPRNNFKQIREDFIRLDASIEDISKELKESIGAISEELTQSVGKIDELKQLIEGVKKEFETINKNRK